MSEPPNEWLGESPGGGPGDRPANGPDHVPGEEPMGPPTGELPVVAPSSGMVGAGPGGPGGPGGSDVQGGPGGSGAQGEFIDPGEPIDPGVRTEAGTAIRRNRRVRRHRRRRLFAIIGSALVLIIVAFGLWYELESHGSGTAGPREVINVQSGDSVGSVLSNLSAHHVIGSPLAFRVYDLVHGSPTIVPGHYLLHQNEGFSQVHAILDGGPNIVAVTVNPGLTLHEVAERVDDLPGHTAGDFSKVASSGVVHSEFSPPGSDNLEGLLGTGDYLVAPGESDTALLTAMVHKFDNQATKAGLSISSAAALGLTPYQVIISASIVEKEGYIVKNMPQVARVIYNRLGKGSPLQMNATVLYSLGQDGGAVTSADLKLQTPYNTYLNVGLTPTPICMSSPEALAAAVHPPAGNWLYFVVVKKDGTEAFSDTFAEQLANEKLAQQRGVG